MIGACERLSLILLAVFIFVMAAGVGVGLIGWAAADILTVLLTAAWLWSTGLLIQRVGGTALGHGCRLIALFGAISVSTAWACDVLAVISAPYADNALTRADALLGFSWLSLMGVLRSHTDFLEVLSYAYVSLTWQPLVLIAALCVSRRTDAAWQFVAAWSIALLFCLIVFPFSPAVGAYAHFGIPKEAVPGVLCHSAWSYPVVLNQLRDGVVTLMSNATLEGMIAMPSFHAAAAVLLAWRFQVFSWLRWPSLALNAAMLVSAVPIGGHYLVDVLAGVAVAVAAIAASSTSMVRMSAWGPPATPAATLLACDEPSMDVGVPAA